MKCPPTAFDLEFDSVVRSAIELAWIDSNPNVELTRHEEGGWIYLDLTTEEISVSRAISGGRHSIDLQHPPEIQGSVIVGKFHTHPNPTIEGWEPGPSPQDDKIDALNGVPDLIRSDQGIFHCGPNIRRSGLTGPRGYPS